MGPARRPFTSTAAAAPPAAATTQTPLAAPAQAQAATAAPSTFVQQPTLIQLRRHFLYCAVPMFGFGLMDNLVMLQAGEIIDTTIGGTCWTLQLGEQGEAVRRCLAP